MPTAKEYVERSNKINARLTAHAGSGHPVTSHLTEAGKEASEALGQLLADTAFWALLANKKPEGDLKPEQISDAALLYHAKVLKDLGHQPPPPAEQLASDLREAVLTNQGAAAENIEQVRQKVIGLKAHVEGLTAKAKEAMSKKAAPAAATGSLGVRLKQAARDACLVLSTAGTLLGCWFAANPPLPPPPRPPIVIVVPAPGQAQPGMQQLPHDLGTIYFWRAPPPPPSDPPGTQRT